jgi:uncharacterized integral membrane protein
LAAVKHISWIITIPVTLLIVVFVLSNRQVVQIDVWPLELSIAGPLYLVLLLSLLAGFLIGAAAMWVSAGASRKRARRAERQVRELEARLAKLARELERAEPAAGGRTAPPAGVPAQQTPRLSA